MILEGFGCELLRCNVEESHIVCPYVTLWGALGSGGFSSVRILHHIFVRALVTLDEGPANLHAIVAESEPAR